MSQQPYIEQRPTYYLQSGNSFQNPYGVPVDELLELILESTPELCAQVVFGRYVPTSGLVFTSALILNLLDSTDRVSASEWMDDHAHASYLAEREHYGVQQRFYGGADLARKNDATVIFVVDTAPLRHAAPARVVYYRRLNRVPWELVYAAIGRASYLFDAPILLDSTGAGDVVASEIESRRYCPTHDRTISGFGRCEDHRGSVMDCDPDNYHRTQSDRYEIQTASKVQLITHLAQVLGHDYRRGAKHGTFGLLRSPHLPELQLELASYHWDDKQLKTDHVIALALAAWMGVREIPTPAVLGHLYER